MMGQSPSKNAEFSLTEPLAWLSFSNNSKNSSALKNVFEKFYYIYESMFKNIKIHFCGILKLYQINLNNFEAHDKIEEQDKNKIWTNFSRVLF